MSVPYAQRAAQQNKRPVAVPLPIWRRLKNLAAELTAEYDRTVTLGEAIGVALDRAEKEQQS